MAVLIPMLKQTFTDANGSPLAGGKLYSYVANSTTPIATWTDSTGLVANTNPIILDAYGQAQVWMAVGPSYKFVLTDADGVIQWTADNIRHASLSSSPVPSGGTSGQILRKHSDTDYDLEWFLPPGGYATQSGEETLTNKTLISPVINTPTGITKSDVGLSNVDNTSDANKPISTATQAALNLKADTSAVNAADSSLQSQINNKADSSAVSALSATVAGKADASALTAHTSGSSVHGVSGAVVGTTDTQDVSNKTFTDGPTFTAIATPTSPATGKMKFYPKSDGSFYSLNEFGTETKVGSGSGGGLKNYVSASADAESGIGSWATYNDGAVSRPVDGTGGTASITWTRSTSNPLAGTASFLLTKPASNTRGHGASLNFSIDAEDKAKPLQIEFSLQLVSGTFVGSSSPSTDSDVIVMIYDVTNGALIEPVGRLLDSMVSGGTYKYRGTFQSASNSTSYRLILHCASTSASAYSLGFDSFRVGPQVVSNGAVVTEWQQYSSTLTVGSGSITNASTVAYWRRVGSNLEINGKTTFSASSAVFSSLSYSIPAGLIMDRTGAGQSDAIGNASFLDNGNAWFAGLALATTTTSFVIYCSNTSATYDTFNNITNTTPFTFGAADTIVFTIKVPIVGWSSNVQMSSDSDTRVIALALQNGGITVPSATATKMTGLSLSTYSKDTSGAFDSSGQRIVVPVSGFYKFNTLSFFSSAAGAGASSHNLQIYKNGSSIITIASLELNSSETTTRTTFIAGTTPPIAFSAGDIIEFYGYQNSGQSRTMTVQTLGMERLSGPSQIAASESVHAVYNTSTTNVSAGAVPIFTVKERDSHSAYSTSTGLFTAPTPGLYAVSITAEYTSTSSTRVLVSINKNGSEDSRIHDVVIPASANSTYSYQGMVYLLSGETTSPSILFSGASLSGVAARNKIRIVKVG